MGQRRILMSQEELQRYHVLSKAIEGRMSALDAAGILYLSRRQVFRLKAKVVESFFLTTTGDSLLALQRKVLLIENFLLQKGDIFILH